VIEGREYLLKPNELLLVYPGEEHSTGKVPENRGRLYWVILKASAADGRWLGLSPPFGADLLRRLADRSLPRQFRAQPAVRRHLEHLLSAGDPGGSSSDLKDQELWWGLRMQHQLIECLISVVASRQNNPTKFPTLPLLKMAAAMSRRPEQRRTVAEMAAATRLSVPQFQRRFKEEIGLPPMEYLSRRRIERACEFLEQTDWPITHVALEVGFASSQYFATVFRKFTGTAPREYRALHR
jgi:transcriptional regulator GlxA family with amidase domain